MSGAGDEGMRVVVIVEPSDFVGDEEVLPLRDALRDVAESHVGHLVRLLTVEVDQ